ncbi:MAG: chemotaxis-specific protein-glutamate methyltransferase CheB [Opitutaceae bacterium]
MTPPKIRVLVVDDSALVRRMARETLDADPEIEVVGVAIDPYEARDSIVRLRPDVLTLDLEMPRMDGLTFLRLLMARRPIPVVVLSSLTPRGSDFALEALRLGAVEVIGKPGGTYTFGRIGPELVAKVKAAARARLRPAHPAPDPSPAPIGNDPGAERPARSLVVLGASTGGVEAFRQIFTALPKGLPPIAIVQHIPALFSRKFAERLGELGPVSVREAIDGDRLEPGAALVAPGDHHLLVHWTGTHHVARVLSGPALWHQRPAVDVLFRSVVDAGSAPHCVAGLLTGMGRDGADGLLRLREHGALTFAQDETTSVVYGMPRAAWENGGAQSIVPLGQIPTFLAGIVRSSPASVPVPLAQP